MKFHTSYLIAAGSVFLLQLSDADSSKPKDVALIMQRNVEHLIKKILSHIGEYQKKNKGEFRCIPDYIPDNLIETLKKSIDCVHVNEKNYVSGKINSKAHQKNFLRCFWNAKKEVQETMKAIDPVRDHCPENMTEKTYQINVTTTFTKTFHINIKNGLEVTQKEIDFGKHFVDSSDQNREFGDSNNTNATEEEHTDAYDFNADPKNNSAEDVNENREIIEETADEISEFGEEEKNVTTSEKVNSFSEKPELRGEVQNETDAFSVPEHSMHKEKEKEEEEENEENGFYGIENEKEFDPSVRYNEYVYEDDSHTDRNESEFKEYFEKIQLQKKNFDYFEAIEKLDLTS